MSWTLPRLIGSGNALDLLWSARKFNGEEAKEIGLAERLVDTGEALSTAQDYVRGAWLPTRPSVVTGNESAGLPPPEHASGRSHA